MICHLLNKFTLTLILVNSLYGLDFSKCKEFYLNTSKEFEETDTALNQTFKKPKSTPKKLRAIHIGEGKYLAYTQTEFNHPKIIKYDFLTGLILFQDTILKQKYTLKELDSHSMGFTFSAINGHSAVQGKIQKPQTSLATLALFSKNIPQNSVISDICYQAYGISTNNNEFIDKKYIELFLNKQGGYSSLGLQIDDNLKITSFNPFASDSIQIGDIILSINGINIDSKERFIDISANLDLNTQATLMLKRGKEAILVSLKPFKKEIPFGYKTSYLEFFGVVLDDNLVVINNPTQLPFKQNDKILRLNQIPISNQAELNLAILEILINKRAFSFLVTRKNFEFFITLEDL